MQYVRLGRTGTRVSRVCLGSGPFGVAPVETDAIELVHAAIDMGINFFDTANSYGNFARIDRPGAPPASERPSSEEILGKALKGQRDRVVLASKVREPVGTGVNDAGLSRRHIMQQIERSLRALDTDHLDLYHMHAADAETPLEETMQALGDLVTQGKVRYLGFSNFSGWKMAAAIGVCNELGVAVPVVHQIGYNLVQRDPEREVIPACRHFSVGVTAYSALAMGLLSGTEVLSRPLYGLARFVEDKSQNIPYADAEVEATKKLEALAGEWGHPTPHLALAWLFSRPGFASAIIGPETIDELAASAPAADLQLEPKQIAALDALMPAPPSMDEMYDAYWNSMADAAEHP
jgi:aryl-alcohol dehydrogenase-like predicted oxidoreductase